MSSSDLVSIIVPALNEAAGLEELYERTRKTLEGLQPFEFIVVDDDTTGQSVGRRIRQIVGCRSDGRRRIDRLSMVIASLSGFGIGRRLVEVC